MIRDYVLLPLIMSVVEKNKREVELTGGSLRALYAAACTALLDRINRDLTTIKKTLKERSIRVIEDDGPHGGRSDIYALHYRYFYRGYDDKFAIMKEVAKAEISIRLGRYVAELGAEIMRK